MSPTGNISTLTQTATSLQSQITNARGDISSIEQKVDNIRLYVSNGERSSSIELSVDGVTVSSREIRFTGDVVFESDLRGGSTTISGDCIRTGEISANYIKLGGKMEVYESLNDNYVGGYLGYMRGQSATGDTTHGMGMTDHFENSQVICTSNGARLSYMDRSSVTCTYNRVSLRGPEIVVDGTLKSSDGTIITSDRNQKEDISLGLDRETEL